MIEVIAIFVIEKLNLRRDEGLRIERSKCYDLASLQHAILEQCFARGALRARYVERYRAPGHKAEADPANIFVFALDVHHGLNPPSGVAARLEKQVETGDTLFGLRGGKGRSLWRSRANDQRRSE